MMKELKKWIKKSCIFLKVKYIPDIYDDEIYLKFTESWSEPSGKTTLTQKWLEIEEAEFTGTYEELMDEIKEIAWFDKNKKFPLPSWIDILQDDEVLVRNWKRMNDIIHDNKLRNYIIYIDPDLDIFSDNLRPQKELKGTGYIILTTPENFILGITEPKNENGVWKWRQGSQIKWLDEVIINKKQIK